MEDFFQVNNFTRSTYLSILMEHNTHTHTIHLFSWNYIFFFILYELVLLDKVIIYISNCVDWACGGQWARCVQFLTTLAQALAEHQVPLCVCFNGAHPAPPATPQHWIQTQATYRQRVNSVSSPFFMCLNKSRSCNVTLFNWDQHYLHEISFVFI